MTANWELVATVWDAELEKPVDILLAVIAASGVSEVPWDVFTFEARKAHFHHTHGPSLQTRFVDGWTFPKFVVYRVDGDKKVIVESQYS